MTLVSLHLPVLGTQQLPVSGAALMLLLMGPHLVRWVRFHRENRILAVLLFLWFVSQAVANLWAEIPVARAVWNALGFPALTAAGAFVLSRLCHGSAMRVAVIVVATSISYCVFLVVSPSALFRENPWKYGLGIPVTIIIAVAVGWLRHRGSPRLAMMLLISLVAVHVAFSFRSLAMVCLVGIGLMLVRRSHHRVTPLRAVSMGIAALLAVWTVSAAITNVVSRGWLGQEQYEKQMYQSQVEGGYLVAGRPELVVSAKVISGQPIVGRGANAGLSFEERQDVVSELDKRGVNISLGQQRRIFGGQLNLHSIALGSWVRGGIMAFTPWVFVLVMLYKRVMREWGAAEAILYPVTLIVTILATWDFLFSPWAPGYEIILGVTWSLALGPLNAGKRGEG
ncbi:hypothetical protein GUY61_12735 [Streptomyces sp. GC420]|nr:hypothetical protein [Streptomyces sp. GC420]